MARRGRHGPPASRARGRAPAAGRDPACGRRGPARQECDRSRRRGRRCHARSVRDASRRVTRRSDDEYDDGARTAAGPARVAVAAQALRAARGRRCVRRHGCRRQGRGDPSDHRRARCAAVPRRADFGAVARGTRAALPLALLVPPAAARQLHDLRSQLVRTRAGRAGAGLRAGARLAARLRRDQRVRAPARRAPRDRRQVLAGGEPRRSSSSGSPSATAIRSSASRSIPRTGPTASTGLRTSARRRKCSRAPTRGMRPGRSCPPTTSATRASPCCARSAIASKPRSTDAHGTPRETALPHIALVSTLDALALDEDMPPLVQALQRAGARVSTPCWDDRGASTGRAFDLAVLRSTWDYVERIDEFRAWARRCAAADPAVQSAGGRRLEHGQALPRAPASRGRAGRADTVRRAGRRSAGGAAAFPDGRRRIRSQPGAPCRSTSS